MMSFFALWSAKKAANAFKFVNFVLFSGIALLGLDP
jgi:hypothetical protein